MRGLFTLLTLGALGVGFVAGRASLPAGGESAAQTIQTTRPLTVTLPGDPRELIPLVPGPGEGPGQPGQTPGAPQPGPQQPPGQAPGEGECTVLLHRDGQFYRLQPGQPGQGQPGQGQPGQPQPGQGQRGDGQPGADTDELFPLEPFGPGPGQPDLPGLPPTLPDTPGLDLRV